MADANWMSAAGEGDSVAARVAEPSLLDRVVAELREIERRSGIERTLAIGALILNRFFRGDPKAWQDRRRNKNNSVRRLAERTDCPFSKSALNEAIAVHVAVLGLPCVRTFGHICASHVASVLRLPAAARQDILEVADRERWSVRELKQRVVALRRAQGERRGRPALEGEGRAISRLQNALADLAEGAKQVQSLDNLSAEASSSLRALGSELVQLGAEFLQLAGDELALARTRPISELRLRERSAG